MIPDLIGDDISPVKDDFRLVIAGLTGNPDAGRPDAKAR